MALVRCFGGKGRVEIDLRNSQDDGKLRKRASRWCRNRETGFGARVAMTPSPQVESFVTGEGGISLGVDKRQWGATVILLDENQSRLQFPGPRNPRCEAPEHMARHEAVEGDSRRQAVTGHQRTDRFRGSQFR